MGFPDRESGGWQLVFVYGLPIVVFAYRYVPLVGVIYGVLPLLYSILGKWVSLPFFFRGISSSFLGAKWVFAGTAILGYVWHLVDQREAARQAKEL
jgi:hypothetical protein